MKKNIFIASILFLFPQFVFSVPTSTPPALNIGRYQYVQHPIGARHQFILDTATGKLWQMVEASTREGAPVVMQRVYFMDFETFPKDYEELQKYFPVKE